MKRWSRYLTGSHRSAALQRELRRSAPPIQAPPGLHEKIMSAVEDSRETFATMNPESETSSKTSPALLNFSFAKLSSRWALASGLALLLGVSFWLAQQKNTASGDSAARQSLSLASRELGSQLSTLNSQLSGIHSAPEDMISPLTGEFDRLSADLNRTAQYLLANVP